jgi:hypothetical protein
MLLAYADSSTDSPVNAVSSQLYLLSGIHDWLKCRENGKNLMATVRDTVVVPASLAAEPCLHLSRGRSMRSERPKGGVGSFFPCIPIQQDE